MANGVCLSWGKVGESWEKWRVMWRKAGKWSSGVKMGASQDSLKDQGYFDSGYSKHMTGNISYLIDFKKHDGGYVSFGGGAKGCKITGKGTIRTEKDIKREFSVARTPKQNGVAKRRNRTLIQAARTMLADSKLPITFWAEAVNTASYVQKRVLVVKSHFKTPYELFKGRSPALCFMRPFGCHVSILNTLDQLGKFDGKSDEGIFVGYSTTSKAFRVYNIRTRKVEENLHITFLENKPMITGSGPEWLFDIDFLLKLMNYAPVSTGTNSNDFANKGASFDAGQSSIETGSSQDYILMPLWKDNSLFDSSSQASDSHNKDKHGLSQASESDNHEKPNAERSTKTINTATPTYADYPNDPLMPDLEDSGIFDETYDDRDEGVEADYNNLKTVILVSLITSTRIHKDHPKEHIIGEVTQDLDDESWVEAKQEELLQLKLLNVWTLVDLPPRKSAIGTKWVYRNKRDQRGIVDRNKARLAIRLFLAYASFMDFTVYQMNMKSEFLYGTIEEEVYVSQPLGFVDLEFPDRVFRRGTIDKTLFIKKIKDDILLVQVYVDDIIFGSTKRFQVQPKVSQMHAVKRIFRYLKGQPTLGLWYPKDSPLELIPYSDSDYTGASLDRKSTTGGLKLKGYLINDGYADLVQHADKKELAIPGKTATDKELSNPLMAGSLPKTTLPTLLMKVNVVRHTYYYQTKANAAKHKLTTAGYSYCC
nr:hypothetical protein [Tanacetum cinerariifolium]